MPPLSPPLWHVDNFMLFVVTGANVVSNMGGVPGAEAARGFVNAVSSDVVTQAWPAIRPPPRMCDRAFLSIGPPPLSRTLE